MGGGPAGAGVLTAGVGARAVRAVGVRGQVQPPRWLTSLAEPGQGLQGWGPQTQAGPGPEERERANAPRLTFVKSRLLSKGTS